MDWKDHIANFTRLAKDAGYTIAQYAEEYGLNPNTARRYLRSNKDSSPLKKGIIKQVNPAKMASASKRAARRAASNDHSDDQNNDHSARDHSKSNTLKNQSSKSESKGTKARKRAVPVVITSEENDHQQDNELITRSRKMMRSRLEKDRAEVGRDFEFHASDFRIDNEDVLKDVRAMLSRTGADDIETMLIEKTMVHLFMLERARDACIELIDDLKRDGDDTPVPQRLTNMLANSSGQIVNLVSTVYAVRNSYRKETREREKHAMAMGNAGIVRLAYEQRREHGWGHQQTASYIEENGGKVPAFLMEQCRSELKFAPNPSDAGGNGGATLFDSLEDLDKAAQARANARTMDNSDWVQDRRAVINDIIDRTGLNVHSEDLGDDGEEWADDDDDNELVDDVFAEAGL